MSTAGTVRTSSSAKAFANEFPIRVVCQVLGFPDEARAQFFYWYTSMMIGLGGPRRPTTRARGRQDLEDYVAGLVAERRVHPTYLYDDAGNPIGKDIITELCETKVDGDVLSTEEITSNIALVVGGGGETTRGAILNMWYLLLQHPDQFAGGRRRRPELWDAAFHETLRHSTSIGGQPRHNTFDVELHGVHDPGRLARQHGRLLGQPRRPGVRRSRAVRHLPPRPVHRQAAARRATARTAAAATWPSASARTCAPARGSPIRSRCSGSKVLLPRLRNARIADERMPKDIDGTSLAPIGLGSIRELWLDVDADRDEPPSRPSGRSTHRRAGSAPTRCTSASASASRPRRSSRAS